MINDPFKEWFTSQSEPFTGQMLYDEPLAKYTYYRIGGPASFFATPKTLADLEFLAQGIQQTQIPTFVLGMGSNLLISDSGFSGLIIRTTRLNLEITRKGDKSICTGSSVAISTLLRKAAQEGWGGLEFLTGVPGSIGGVVRMNAGTYLGEVKNALKKITTFSLSTLKTEIHEKEAFRFEYRKNLFLPKDSIVYSAEWDISPGAPSKVKASIDEILARRKATQPVDYPSCGSVFINPKDAGLHSWQVIEKLGLRGHTIGDAQFSEKHSNFIINLGKAKASDVKALIDLAKSRALNELGITLQEEVIFLGT